MHQKNHLNTSNVTVNPIKMLAKYVMEHDLNTSNVTVNQVNYHINNCYTCI
mgnify:CR=1 FL=1